MKTLILCNGEPVSQALLNDELMQADLVICADGALKWAQKMNPQIKIDVLVGDFDSLGLEQAKAFSKDRHCELVTLAQHKDQTDTHVCIEIAKAKGTTEITFLGALGKRFDHSLCNVELLVVCARLGIFGMIKDDNCEITTSCTLIELSGEMNDLVSLIPLGVNTYIKKTYNLGYPLENAPLELGAGASLGISNYMTQKQAKVEISHGWVVAIKTKQSYA